MPWMKLLAQLPTPTIATRTLSSVRPTPLVLWPLAPLLSLMDSEVLLDCAGWLDTPGGFAGYRSPAPPPAPLTSETSPESSLRTCHTRWHVVKIVRAATT